MKASISEVKGTIASYIHSAFLDREYIIEKTRQDDGHLDCVISVDAILGGGTLRYEIRDNERRKKYYDPLAWIDEIEKWDALFF